MKRRSPFPAKKEWAHNRPSIPEGRDKPPPCPLAHPLPRDCTGTGPPPTVAKPVAAGILTHSGISTINSVHRDSPLWYPSATSGGLPLFPLVISCRLRLTADVTIIG